MLLAIEEDEEPTKKVRHICCHCLTIEDERVGTDGAQLLAARQESPDLMSERAAHAVDGADVEMLNQGLLLF